MFFYFNVERVAHFEVQFWFTLYFLDNYQHYKSCLYSIKSMYFDMLQFMLNPDVDMPFSNAVLPHERCRLISCCNYRI